MNQRPERHCPDCDTSSDSRILDAFGDRVSRRGFLGTIGGAAAVAGATQLLPGLSSVHAAPSAKSTAETAVKALYDTFSDQQAAMVCLPFDHQLRNRINANWKISNIAIGSDFYSNEQKDLITQIVKGITSEDGYDRLTRQMKADAGGIDRYSMVVFGEPGTDKFEWELTGRHLTLRADGNSAPGAAFGGPIVYGHGVEDPAKNLFYYQTKQVNEVFKALDAKQAQVALLDSSPTEDEVALQGKAGKFPGLAVADLSSDQKELVASTLKVLLGIYRDEDVQEVMAILKEGGGLDSLHMSYYSDSDLKGDKIWDVWRIEGPSFVWHFRGDPHVHAYINIGVKA
ncbi:MAG: DUF3500 domain-containing protein [Rhodopirellula sp.]|nr:DUF3500 domain-containing protein [Rhodopirellula sp.]